jgi:hypothetical protein
MVKRLTKRIAPMINQKQTAGADAVFLEVKALHYAALQAEDAIKLGSDFSAMVNKRRDKRKWIRWIKWKN